MSDTEKTILLDIYEKLGSVDAKLTAITKLQGQHDDDIQELQTFKTRIGAYIWIGGAIVAGAIGLLWEGLQYFSVEIRAALARLFH